MVVEAAAANAANAAGPILRPPGTQANPPTLSELKAYLGAIGVPSELFPMDVPKGAKSYTLKHPNHPTHKGSLQILHAKRGFYLTSTHDGSFPLAPSVTWSTHGSCKDAWEWAKKILEW